jgi:hypothetical protein
MTVMVTMMVVMVAMMKRVHASTWDRLHVPAVP